MTQRGSERSKPRVLIIGVGNAYRRDDAVGLMVARRLQEKKLAGVRILEASGEGASLIESWNGADSVILIDAVQSDAAPGALYRLDAHIQAIPTDFFHYSTHAFSVAEAVELARALNRLPPRLIVYGIEGKDFQSGEGLSPEVEKAALEVFKQVLRETNSLHQ